MPTKAMLAPAAEIMSRLAAAMVGGMISAVLLTLLVLPAIYLLWKQRSLRNSST